MSSIRSRLLFRLLVSTALILIVVGLAVFLVVRRSLGKQFDQNLEDRLQGLASLLFQEGETLAFEFSEELMPEYARTDQPAFFELSFEDGRPIEKSESLKGYSLRVPEGQGTHPLLWSLTLPEGRKGRAMTQVVEVHHVYPEEGPDRPQAARVRISVARGIEERIAGEHFVLLSCIACAGALLALLSLTILQAVRRGLEPANRLARTLENLDVNHLPESLAFGALPIELQPIAQTTEELVQRLATALQRERRTTANIAHELRTPISELVTVSEVALHEDEDLVAQREAIGTIRSVAWRMGRVVTSLLKLARLESEEMGRTREEVDFRLLIRAVHQGLALANKGTGPAIDFDFPVDDGAGSKVLVDPDALAIVLTNLLENAMHYAIPLSRIGVELRFTEAEVKLSIRNQANDLSQEDVHRFSEPLWRKDDSRSDQEHCGLGLALAQVIAQRSGWSIAFVLDSGWVEATLRVPHI